MSVPNGADENFEMSFVDGTLYLESTDGSGATTIWNPTTLTITYDNGAGNVSDNPIGFGSLF